MTSVRKKMHDAQQPLVHDARYSQIMNGVYGGY